MKPFQANLLNAIVLIAMGLWGYFETSAPTAFIPVGIGAVLLLCSNGVKKENKIIAHIAVLLTLMALLAFLGMRLPKALETGGLAIGRAVLPIITGVLAMFAFIQSFRAARKARG